MATLPQLGADPEPFIVPLQSSAIKLPSNGLAELLVEVTMLGGLATFPDVCKLSFSLRIRSWTRRAERKCNPQLQNSFWNSDLEARVGVEPTLRVFEALPSLVRHRASQNFL